MEVAPSPAAVRNTLVTELSNVGRGLDQPLSYPELTAIIQQKSVREQ